MSEASPLPVVRNGPLWRLAARRWRRRPLQYLLCILGIALGVAMLVSIDLASGSAQRAFSLSTDAITGRTTHRLVAIGPGGVPDTTFVELRHRFPEIPAAPVIEAYGRAEELDGELLRLVGVDLFSEAPFRGLLGGEGGGERGGGKGFVPFLTEPGTAVIATETAARFGLHPGAADGSGTLHLDLAGRTSELRLVGSVSSDGALERRGLETLLLVDIATAQDLLDPTGAAAVPAVGHIDLILEGPTQEAALSEWLPRGLKLETAAARGNAVQQMTAAFELNLTAMSLLAMVVGIFLIYNTVTFSVVQRRGLFGVLRCLGVTRGQLFALILGEAALFSLVGSLLGLALGVLLGRTVVGLITQTINDFYFVVSVRQISLSGFTLAKGMLVGVASALVASALPAWEAMATPPQMTLQRSNLESGWQRLLPWFLLAALLCGSLGVLLLRWNSHGLVSAFAGLFALLMGAALLMPPVLVAAMQGLGWASRGLPVVARLAPRDILRSLSRTAVAVAALMVAVSVIVGLSIMIGSFRGTVVTWLDQTLQADLFVSPPSTTANRVLGKVDPAIIQAIAERPDLRAMVTYNNFDVHLVDQDRDITLIAAGGDVSAGRRPYAWIRPGLDDPFAALEARQGVILSEAVYLRDGQSAIPEQIRLETPDGERSFPVIAVFYDYSSDRGSVLMDRSQVAELWHDDSVASLGLFLAPGADADAVAAELRQGFGSRQTLLVQTNGSLRQGSLEIFDRTFAITGALQLLTVVVAFIGIFSTLMSLQLERGREFAVLRATGMTPRQLGRLTLLETGLMGLLAGACSMPLGFVLAWVLVHVINVRSFGWTLQIALEPRFFIQSLLIAVGAAVLAGLYPALRLGRMNISEALRQE
ncbi:ABC transporter permease [Synechococcus sp. CS-1332]|uniref:ABC transporter permease n=1 Tax=Synechococcus sp. CS-1332 TaxID=2847972 RepID=UPI00223AC043|nr:ABC transporter permease [Synechococcus sp. CS-1332]MCT0207333.1 ABC transporter permease [Synechococcus sp. CS-1332]